MPCANSSALRMAVKLHRGCLWTAATGRYVMVFSIAEGGKRNRSGERLSRGRRECRSVSHRMNSIQIVERVYTELLQTELLLSPPYEPMNEFDGEIERQIAEEFATTSSSFPVVDIKPGYNTNQMLNHFTEISFLSAGRMSKQEETAELSTRYVRQSIWQRNRYPG